MGEIHVIFHDGTPEGVRKAYEQALGPPPHPKLSRTVNDLMGDAVKDCRANAVNAEKRRRKQPKNLRGGLA